MNAYGNVAVQAVELLRGEGFDSPAQAWEAAARAAFPHSQSLQDKSCPRLAFLGLCEDGRVAGVPPGTYTRSVANKAYAVRAAGLLAASPDLASRGAGVLWDRVIGASKAHNSQMDVVLGLHSNGLLVRK